MKKIGTLKGIPVVEGNVNEVTKNQIHYKENGGGIQLSKRDNENKLNSITSGSSSSGNSSRVKYYNCINGTSMVLAGELCTAGYISNVNVYTYDSLNNPLDTYISGYNLLVSQGLHFATRHITFQPISIIIEGNRVTINSLEELCTILGDPTYIKSFKEITEEEFYKID